MFPATKGERECDHYGDGVSLKKAFEEFCFKCNKGCPMGCIRIQDEDAYMQCFAEWAMSKYNSFKNNDNRHPI